MVVGFEKKKEEISLLWKSLYPSRKKIMSDQLKIIAEEKKIENLEPHRMALKTVLH